MPQTSFRSQLRRREDGVRGDRDGGRSYEAFEDGNWYPDEDLEFASIPGLDGDTRSAAYILQAVEALSRPAGAAQRGLGSHRPDPSEVHAEWRMMHRTKAMLHVHHHGIATRSLKKDISKYIIDDNTTISQYSSDEEAASSIRTDSSLDDVDSMPDEFLDGTALDRRRSLDALSWNNTQIGAVTATMLPSIPTLGTQPGTLELEYGWGIHYEERLNRPLIASSFLGVIILAGLFGMYWAKSRSDIQGAFSISAYIIMLAGVFLSIMIQRGMTE